MEETDRELQKARYDEMREVYGYLVEAQLYPFKEEVTKLEGLVGQPGFDAQALVVQELLPTIPEAYQNRLVAEVERVHRALESHDKAKSKPKPKSSKPVVEREKPKPKSKSKRRREKEEPPKPKIVLIS